MENLLKKIDKKKKKLDSFRPLPLELVRNLDDWLKEFIILITLKVIP